VTTPSDTEILGFNSSKLLNCPKYDARVAFEFYGFTHHLKQPIRHSLGPLYQSYKKGLRYGVIEDALMVAGVHCSHYFCSGRPLLQLSGILKECLSLAEEYVPTLYLSIVAYGQLVQNLIGKAPNSSVLNGDIMDLEETMHKIKINNDTAALRMVNQCPDRTSSLVSKVYSRPQISERDRQAATRCRFQLEHSSPVAWYSMMVSSMPD
jgi:hypothetical protein